MNNQDNPILIDEKEFFEHFHFDVDAGQEPLRIDKFLMNRMEKISRNKIQNAAKAESILVNGKPVKSNYKVRPGDSISLVMAEPPRYYEIEPEQMDLDIVYEDDFLIVVNKPSGIVVHPGHGNYTGTLVHGLLYHFKELPKHDDEDVRPGLVHRIDKDTTGLMVVAKEDYAMTHLANQFFERTVNRTYTCLVWGNLDKDQGTIKGNIGRSTRDRKVFTVFEEAEKGKHATTHYKVIERLGYVNVVECKLETGRTHQIRVHMKHIGHPLFNDANYGGDKLLRGSNSKKYNQFIQNAFGLIPRQALHASTLGFIHPDTGEEMRFESELPNDLNSVIQKWRDYIATLK